jgi:limonene-1,2-epoxide hydrolase
MSTTPETIVRDFCAAFRRKNVDEILAFFAADAVYHNMPIDPVRGTDAIRAVLEQFVGPAESAEFEILHLAASGNVVHTERVDRFRILGRDVALPVAGVFEVEGGKITAWRDYFDMQQFMRQSGMG